jgi:hypothetical protein
MFFSLFYFLKTMILVHFIYKNYTYTGNWHCIQSTFFYLLMLVYPFSFLLCTPLQWSFRFQTMHLLGVQLHRLLLIFILVPISLCRDSSFTNPNSSTITSLHCLNLSMISYACIFRESHHFSFENRYNINIKIE